MTNKLYIDGIDAYTQFGIFVHDRGYGDLVGYPPLKAVEFNDWPEEDGIEPDLTAPRLDTKTFVITFGGTAAPMSEQFVNFLSSGAYHVFDFREIGITRRLRMVSQQSKNTVWTLEIFALQFADDFPLGGYEYEEPVPIGVYQSTASIDGRSFADYGIWITEGSADDITKSPAVKQNLLVNGKTINGALYDGETVVFKEKDVNLKCHIRAGLATFWRNYNALLHDLIQPGERLFYYEKNAEEYPCFYKACKVSTFSVINGEVWCDFTLTLTFITFRVGDVEYLLAAEDGAFIVMEDGETFIDMQAYGYK